MSLVIRPSLKAASATESLMVEQGWAPLDSASRLVDHGKNAAAGRLNGDYSAVQIAQRIDRCLAHDGIFTGDGIAFGDVLGKRTGGETLVVVVTAPRARWYGGVELGQRGCAPTAASVSGVLGLTDLL